MQKLIFKMRSRKLGSPVEVLILAPEPGRGAVPADFYTSGRRYPVLWLLHGGGGDCEDWLNGTTLMRFAAHKELFIVMPSAMNSDYANHPEFGGGYLFTDFFFEELMPFVHGWLPVSEKREDNYLAGLSMGASGSLLLSFTHPEKFDSVSVMSGSLRQSDFLKPFRGFTSDEFRAYAQAHREELPCEYTPDSGITDKEINMIAKYPTVGAYLDSYECLWERFPELAAQDVLPEYYMTCGKNDFCYEKLLAFRQRVEELGAQGFTFEFMPGYGHQWEFWDEAIQKSFRFFGL